MSLFHHKISLPHVDPLGGGLAEEIAYEQQESEAMTLEEGIDEGQLSVYWNDVEKDIEKDPEWFTFADD